MTSTVDRLTSYREENFLDTEEACQVLGVSKPTLFKLIKSGTFKFIKPSRTYLIAVESIEEYLTGKPL